MKQTSIKKRTAKFFKYFLIIFTVFFIALFLIGNLAEKKITAIAFNRLKTSIKVPIESDDISFTLIKRFPLATFEFNNFMIGSPDVAGSSDSATVVTDTLINIGKLYISVKSTPLIDGVFDIQKIEIVGANIDFAIDRNGISNFDFLIDTTETESTDTTSFALLDLTLQKLLLKDITCYYYDSLTTTKAKIKIPEINLKGKIKRGVYSGFIDGSVLISESDFKDTYLNRMRETKVDFEMGFENDSLKINTFNIVTDGAVISATGTSVLKDEIYADINIKGENIDLAELIKYAPEDSLKKYNIKGVKGDVSFDASINGVVSDSLQPHLNLLLKLREGELLTSGYPVLKNISFDVNATNGELQNEETTTVDVQNFKAETDSSSFSLDISVKNLKKNRFKITSDLDICISEFRQLIPDSLVNDISGIVKAKIKTKGVMPDSIDDDFYESLLQTSSANVIFSDVNVSMDSLPEISSFSGTFNYHHRQLDASAISMSVPDYHVNIKNSSFKTHLSGKLLQPEKTTIDVKSFVFNTDSSRFSGSASVQNLKAPVYSINGNLELNLSEMKDMVPDSLINDISGSVTSTITSSGELNPDSISEQINDIVFERSLFAFRLNNVSVKMPDTLMCVSNLSGDIKMVPDTMFIDKLTGMYKNIDFGASKVKVVNLYNTYFKNLHEQLYVEGAFNLGDIDYSYFAPLMDTTTTVQETTLSESSINGDAENLDTEDTINYTFLIKGKLSVSSFKYQKADIKNISALFNLRDSIYTIDKLTFDAFKGKMVSSVIYNYTSENRQILTFRNHIEGMDISQLLSDFDNFDQKEITSEQVSGLLSTDIDGWLVLLGDTVVNDSIYLKGDIKLENGGLFNYAPAMELANFTNIRELDNMHFKTMNSSIFIFHNSIYVPRTEIKSNAMNITAYGMQSFGEDYEYHLKIYLGEILRGKSKHMLKKQAELENNPESNKKEPRSLYVVSYSLDGKMKNGLDNKKMRQKMNMKIRLQKKVLSVIFHPKLVNFNTGVPDYLK